MYQEMWHVAQHGRPEMVREGDKHNSTRVRTGEDTKHDGGVACICRR